MSDPLTSLHKVHVALGERAYDILIGHDWLESIARAIPSDLGDFEHAACICDSSIEETWGRRVHDALVKPGRRVDRLVIPSGESSKSIEHLGRIWEWLLASRADRRTVLFAIGGGVIGDLAGMAAGTFTRGIRFVQIPTTLLAHVDSSVGGKTGINLPAAKNMVGVFWQPSLVAIDTATLTTLPARETRSGWAEIVKYGVILDAEFFAFLEASVDAIGRGDATVTARAIQRSCELKAQVVVADERETTGLRAVLNYGHTFAHAIEATCGYGAYLHGEAVSIGMQMAARLAERMALVDSSFAPRQDALLKRLGLPTRMADANEDAMIQAMQHDKKVAHGKLRFVLPTRLGHVELVGQVPEEQVRQAIRDCCQ